MYVDFNRFDFVVLGKTDILNIKERDSRICSVQACFGWEFENKKSPVIISSRFRGYNLAILNCKFLQINFR